MGNGFGIISSIGRSFALGIGKTAGDSSTRNIAGIIDGRKYGITAAPPVGERFILIHEAGHPVLGIYLQHSLHKF